MRNCTFCINININKDKRNILYDLQWKQKYTGHLYECKYKEGEIGHLYKCKQKKNETFCINININKEKLNNLYKYKCKQTVEKLYIFV